MCTYHCWKQHRVAFKRQTSKKCIKIRREFEIIFPATFFNQNQSEYYGRNQSVSTEGIYVDNVFLKQKFSNKNISSYQYSSIFHSFVSDSSSKYGATTSAHQKTVAMVT